MTNLTDELAQSHTGVEQVKERVQDAAEQAKGQTRQQLRTQINERSTQAGEQMSSTAQAMRRTTEQLRGDGNERAASLIDGIADRSERLGGYLSDADGDQILRDVEEFARRQPWLMVAGSAALGFLASRFMKASSSSRYQSQVSPSPAYPSRTGQSASAPRHLAPGLPPATGAVVGDTPSEPVSGAYGMSGRLPEPTGGGSADLA